MNKRQKRDLYRIIIALLLFVPLFAIEHLELFEVLPYTWMPLLICFVPYLIVGYDVIKKAMFNIAFLINNMFCMNFYTNNISFLALQS